ncbi:hypothetical protein AALP_AA4G036400 [Arabis alpina]|uniref:Uncharacterized protein n=1 Tax=Arabis alpina TaxID=50452 RepID=A0A087H0Y3_ARAAL|nr:hypothetical protein AALP_AA4G036400 [Arabis alpina]
MERGSDRLALITGQLHSFDPSSPSASSSSSSATHNRTYSESSMQKTRLDHYVIQESPSLKYKFKEEVKAREEPKLSTPVHKPIQTSEPTKKEEPRSIKTQSQVRPRSIFSSKKLNASIIISERTRSLSSLTIATMVILLPRLNIISSNTILALRPLWLLILTDCAIVMSHLTMEASQGLLSHEMEEEEKVKDGNNGANWSDAEKLLERGVVVYQALRGMLIDCSLYMVIVICCGVSHL